MSRYIVEFEKEVDQKLKAFAQAKDMSKGEVIRRALAMYVYLKEEAAQGRHIAIKDNQSHAEQELVLP